MSPPRFVLSDMDGVLVDSTEAVARAWRWWADDVGLDFAVVREVMYGTPSREVAARLVPDRDAAAESQRIEDRQSTDLAGVVAVPGAAELLDTWPADRLAVVTSASPRLAAARLGHAGLTPPATMITADRISAGKPDPEGYLTAAAALGAPPAECVVLEDAPVGLEAAAAAGMRAIGVLTTYPRAELPAADAYVDDLRGIADVIASLGA